METSEAIEQFKCPVCLEIPPDHVLQCKSGHTICSQCESTLEECPICRVPYGEEKIRNLQIEYVLDTMKFPCPKEGDGCGEMLDRREILDHDRNCTVKLYNVCKMMGYKCSYEFDRKQVDYLEAHLKSSHFAQLQEGLEVQLVHETFDQNSPQFLDTIWNPVILRSDGHTFLVTCFVNGATETASWTCLILDDFNSKEANYEAEFCIPSVGEINNQDIQWRQACVPYSKADKMFTSFQVPVALLQENYGNDGRLSVLISIQKYEKSGLSLPKELPFPTLVTVSSQVEYESGLELETNVDTAQVSDEAEQDHDHIVFAGSACALCSKTPITGVMFQCLNCQDFVLCKKCFSPKMHAHHIFAMLHSTFHASLKSNSSVFRRLRTRTILPIVKNIDPEFHNSIKAEQTSIFATSCDCCGSNPIVGVLRYKCLQCKKYDLCVSCAGTGLHTHHIFGIISNSFQDRFLNDWLQDGVIRWPLLK